MQVYVAASCENRGRREVDCIIKKVLKTVESFVSRKERERETDCQVPTLFCLFEVY